MVELTGEMGEEAQQVLDDLHLGIDAGKKIATTTHDFEVKLLAIDMLILHIQLNYMEHEDLNEFFMEISDELVELRDQLEALKKGEIHVVLEEEAAEKMETLWILKHRKKVEDEIKEEAAIDKAILQKVHQAFRSLKEKFSQADHLFSVDIEKAAVEEVKLELEEAEEEVKHILQKLMGFFVTYEKIFREELDRLSIRRKLRRKISLIKKKVHQVLIVLFLCVGRNNPGNCEYCPQIKISLVKCGQYYGLNCPITTSNIFSQYLLMFFSL